MEGSVKLPHKGALYNNQNFYSTFKSVHSWIQSYKTQSAFFFRHNPS